MTNSSMSPGSRYTAGALDLGEVKARAEAKEKAENNRSAGGSGQGDGGLQPYFAVTDQNFEAEVLRRSAEVPVIVFIGSPRSPASQQLEKDFSELAAAGNFSFLVGYVDADTYPQVAQVFGVQNLPTTIALGAGQPLTNFEGSQPREALQQWVDTLVSQVGPQLQGPGPELQAAQAGTAANADAEESEATDPRISQAESALNAGDFDAAISSYEEILQEDPNNAEISQARDTARLLKRLGKSRDGDDPITAADKAPEDIEAQKVAADAEVVAGKPEAAFDRLIAALQRCSGDEKAAVRERLLELFALFDAGDPRVLNARTKLASALY